MVSRLLNEYKGAVESNLSWKMLSSRELLNRQQLFWKQGVSIAEGLIEVIIE